MQVERVGLSEMCFFEHTSERHLRLNLDGGISACIHARVYVRDVRAFEVGDPAAR